MSIGEQFGKVQPFLQQIFEGISDLDFDKMLMIRAIFSSYCERVTLIEKVDPVIAEGKVEKWLAQLEMVMRSTMKGLHWKAMYDLGRKDREKWAIYWNGMTTLSVAKTVWTAQTERAMFKGGIAGLKEIHHRLERQVSSISYLY